MNDLPRLILPMHALCKSLFFTTGTVGLLLLVFLWSALEYNLFKMDHFIVVILNYRFAGFTITDFLQFSPSLDPGQRIHILKLLISGCVGLSSLFLILLSYLPRISLQFRFLSALSSAALFTILGLFWICLINGTEVIKLSEKSAIFGLTAITYLSGIFLLWYAMRVKRPKHEKNAKQNVKGTEAIKPSTTASSKMEEETSNESQQPTDNPDVQAETSETDSKKDVDNSDELTGGEGNESADGEPLPETGEEDGKSKEDSGSKEETESNSEDLSDTDISSSEDSLNPTERDEEPIAETETQKGEGSEDDTVPEAKSEKEQGEKSGEPKTSENLKIA